MNPGRYYIPNIGMNTMPMVSPILRQTRVFPVGINLLSKISNGVRNFNWKGLLNGANKTLNVFNQAIPLIRQAKPMVGNVKSMMQLAKAFRKETGNTNIINNYKNITNDINRHKKSISIDNTSVINSVNDMPTFFV